MAVAILLSVITLPLLGAALTSRDLGELAHFPPQLQIPTDYPRFSWLAAGGVILILTAIAWSWVVGRSDHPPSSPAPADRTHLRHSDRRFPLWGWAAFCWVLLWWILAWSRWPWFEPFQRFTFFPLWLGFILVINALTHQRTNTCLMIRAPGIWLGLFGASAIFWWSFEWLNRFVKNWHYLGVEEFGPVSYALHASLCFSTVLPAVAAVAEWLDTHSGWLRATSRGPAWKWFTRSRTAAALGLTGITALVFTGAYPQSFYPALWVAPLMLLLAESVLSGRRSLANEIGGGDWRRAATWMTAALMCGFFWELWNWRSLAKWVYTVPGVERWHVFEMPLLGYAGYLPFGLECLLVIERLLGVQRFSAEFTALRSSAPRPAWI